MGLSREYRQWQVSSWDYRDWKLSSFVHIVDEDVLWNRVRKIVSYKILEKGCLQNVNIGLLMVFKAQRRVVSGEDVGICTFLMNSSMQRYGKIL